MWSLWPSLLRDVTCLLLWRKAIKIFDTLAYSVLHTSGTFNCPFHVNVHTFHCIKLNEHTWNMRNKIANKYKQMKRTRYQQRTINFLKTFYWCFQWRCLWGVDKVNGASLALGLLCYKQHLVGKCKHCYIACCANDNNKNV